MKCKTNLCPGAAGVLLTGIHDCDLDLTHHTLALHYTENLGQDLTALSIK